MRIENLYDIFQPLRDIIGLMQHKKFNEVETEYSNDDLHIILSFKKGHGLYTHTIIFTGDMDKVDLDKLEKEIKFLQINVQKLCE